MAFTWGDRVKETTTTTGTGTLSLAGAVAQYQSFVSGIGTTNQCKYVLYDGNGTASEVGIGTVTSGSPNTLSRTTVLFSTNSNALISLSANTHTVLCASGAAEMSNRLCAPIVPPPVASNWTHRGFGASTAVQNVANGVSITDTSAASVAAGVAGISLTAPSTPYTIDANFTGNAYLTAANTYYQSGLGWTDGTKAQIMLFSYEVPGTIGMVVQNYSAYNTYVSAAVSAYDLPIIPMSDYWMRIADNGTNVTYSFGGDGVYWQQVYTVAKSSGYLGSSGYSNVMMAFSNIAMGNGGTISTTLRSWWQH